MYNLFSTYTWTMVQNTIDKYLEMLNTKFQIYFTPTSIVNYPQKQQTP